MFNSTAVAATEISAHVETEIKASVPALILVSLFIRKPPKGMCPAVTARRHYEIQRRVADMESGKVRGIPLEETLARARTVSGQ
jgi:hypothetical protein